MSRETGKRRSIENALHRRGLHVRAAEIVRYLAEQGMRVSEELVTAVRVEMLKRTGISRTRQGNAEQLSPSHRPQKKPPRRG